jgi:hypothetical protein
LVFISSSLASWPLLRTSAGKDASGGVKGEERRREKKVMNFKNFKGWLGFVALVALVSVFAAGCAPTQPTGTVEFRAMDAPPTGVSSIMVTTSNIQIHKADASENSWITVVSQEKTFDLVAIQNAEVFLGSANVSSGNYTQIRLDVTKVIVTMNGVNITAKLPSDKLKVVGPWEVKAGEKTILTLDFQADTFVVITGNGQAQVKPVIKLAVSQGERPLKTK